MDNFTKFIPLLLCLACHEQAGEPRSIRGHKQPILGVSHAFGLRHAERYCHYCHGSALIGGQDLEPSCFACHGKNWLDDDPLKLHAPSNHTQQIDLWFHDPRHQNAVGNCGSCHGEDLQGDHNLDTPSCYLCHSKIW